MTVKKKQMSVLLKVAYDGTQYCGWQIQRRENRVNDNAVTVQQRLQESLFRLFSERITINYAGRTDRGVHALAQHVNFTCSTKIPLSKIKGALNSFLSNDICIKSVRKVASHFHARYAVKSKIYRYVICTSRRYPLFERNQLWWIPAYLDVSAMRDAALHFIGRKDFSPFVKGSKTYKDCIRQVKKLIVVRRKSRIVIDIEADGFLRNMVRNIVSLLVKIGLGKYHSSIVPRIFNKTIAYSNIPAPPQGLYLYKVIY